MTMQIELICCGNGLGRLLSCDVARYPALRSERRSFCPPFRSAHRVFHPSPDGWGSAVRTQDRSACGTLSRLVLPESLAMAFSTVLAWHDRRR